ncbi:hypothetical protein VT06_07975 [Arsukibacterium sp. MJ3]|uniref:CsiV family protein n=1 Tax=Arsukibacterium sp. MJ3 TaxID=1632859 RepID=UPI0006274126|nr:CsiV family protein [Arsukibacterium sp. MJ3]KKO49172.1 hypothetical protein VT06_07975 [Arsukibacterium sp. MJ3]
MKLSFITNMLSALTLTLTATTVVANSNANERWFEVELIVFSHAGSSKLKEQFSQEVKPIRLSNSIDLVSAMYQPDIQSLLQNSNDCNLTGVAPVSLLPAELRNWQRWQPRLYPLFCISEPQVPAWFNQGLFPERQLNTQLPMPARMPVQLAAKADSHQSVPYLAPLTAFALNDVASKINRQPNQHVILHTVWRQAPVTERLAIPSRWFAGENYSSQIDYWGQRITPAAMAAITPANPLQYQQQDDVFSAIDTLLAQLTATGKLENLQTGRQSEIPISDNLSNVPAEVWQLDGLFKLHLDHYLFVNTEFNLWRPMADTMQSINVKQSRRVISGEIHYLDHPYLGIVLQIRRYQPPEL